MIPRVLVRQFYSAFRMMIHGVEMQGFACVTNLCENIVVQSSLLGRTTEG